MKKKYETPQVEKMEFDYSETVVASTIGYSYQLYTDKYEGCQITPTGKWYTGLVGDQAGCKKL